MALARTDIVCEECGNTFTYRKKCANRKDADYVEEWAMENITLCPECYKKLQKENIAYQNEKDGFPPLIGSEKQNSWAETIRRDFYDLMINKANTSEDLAFLQYIIKTVNESSVWIENRYFFVDKKWLRDIYEEYAKSLD